MQQPGYMKTLDEIARKRGYLVAARTETIMAALLAIGLQQEDIHISDTRPGVTITVVACRNDAEAGRSHLGTIPFPSDLSVNRDTE